MRGFARATGRRLAYFVRHIVQLDQWLIGGIAGVVVLLVVVVALVLKRSANAPSNIRRSQPSGPDKLNYVCAGCAGQFAHSRRTVAAWEKGTRRFYCNVCHKKWRNQQPPPEAQSPVRVPVQSGRSSTSSAGAYSTKSTRAQSATASQSSRGGCLTVIVLAIVIPAGIWLVTTYA